MNKENIDTDLVPAGTFLLLNNHISWEKQILHIDSVPSRAKKFEELCCSGFTDTKIPVLQKDNVTLIFDGFLSNYNVLSEYIDIEENPYEVIIHLYKKYGIEYTLQLLQGEFSLVLIDNDLQKLDSRIFVARDIFGLKPFYMLTENNPGEKKIYGFSSCIKHLNLESTVYNTDYRITEFPPGSYSEYVFPYKVLSFWRQKSVNISYHSQTKPSFLPVAAKQLFLQKTEFTKTLKKIRHSFIHSVEECLSTSLDTGKETPTRIACLLSGGLNSSLIAGMVQENIRKNNKHKLHTYSIGFANSDDVKYARKVATYLNTIHNEIIITEDEYIDLIPLVVSLLETTDIFTLRSGIAMYILAKRVKEDNIHTVLSGDGANELTGGYLYCHGTSNMFEYDYECRSLLLNYASFQGLYVKIMNYFELNWQRPFLKQSFVHCYQSIPLEFRFRAGELDIFENAEFKYIEKFLLRTAFAQENFTNSHYVSIIPVEILWRTSTLCFDGMCIQSRPIYEITEEKISKLVLKHDIMLKSIHAGKFNNNTQIEQCYYQYFFELFFSKETDCDGNSKPAPCIVDPVLAYEYNSGKLEKMNQKRWLPKYVDEVTDPSSRKLPFYYDYNDENSDRSL
jgi:asparagine synthase (glutamine-hydrolysing)